MCVRLAGAQCPLYAEQSRHRSKTVSALPAVLAPTSWGPWTDPMLSSLGICCSISSCHLDWGHLSALFPQHSPLLCGQCVLSSLLSCLSSSTVPWSCLAAQQGQMGAGGLISLQDDPGHGAEVQPG